MKQVVKKAVAKTLAWVVAASMGMTMSGVSALAEGENLPQITGFSIPQQVASYVYQETKEIHVVMPDGTNVTALTPQVSHTGTDYTPKGAQDFTDPVPYQVVSGQDSQDYTAAVTLTQEAVTVLDGQGIRVAGCADLAEAVQAVAQLEDGAYTLQVRKDTAVTDGLLLPEGKQIILAGLGEKNGEQDTRPQISFAGDLTMNGDLTVRNVKLSAQENYDVFANGFDLTIEETTDTCRTQMQQIGFAEEETEVYVLREAPIIFAGSQEKDLTGANTVITLNGGGYYAVYGAGENHSLQGNVTVHINTTIKQVKADSPNAGMTGSFVLNLNGDGVVINVEDGESDSLSSVLNITDKGTKENKMSFGEFDWKGDLNLNNSAVSLPGAVSMPEGTLSLSKNSMLYFGLTHLGFEDRLESVVKSLVADDTENSLLFIHDAQPDVPVKSSGLMVTGDVTAGATPIFVEIKSQNEILGAVPITSGEKANSSLTSNKFEMINNGYQLNKSGNNLVVAKGDMRISDVKLYFSSSPVKNGPVGESGSAYIEQDLGFSLTSTAWDGYAGSVWLSGETPKATITLIANTGYTFKGIKAENIRLSGAEGAKVIFAEGQGVSGDRNEKLVLTVVYPMFDGYEITVDSVTHGTIVSSQEMARAGETVYLHIQPDEGYRVKADTIKYILGSAETKITGASFQMPAGAVKISARFEPIPSNVYHEIKIDGPLEHGTLYVTPAAAAQGETVIVTAVPDEGYSYLDGSLKCNDKAVNNMSFVMPDEDAILYAEFTQEVRQARLTLSVTEGGYIIKGKNGVYTKGATMDLAAVPYTNYRFDGWTSSNGGVFSNANSTTTQFTMPGVDTTVTAHFKYSGSGNPSGGSSGGSGITSTGSYTVTASAGAGGTISPSGTVSMGKGTAKTFTITPQDGYQIKDVLVNGESVGAVSSYSYVAYGNATIAASFEKIGEGGQPASVFDDIDTHWAKNDILYVTDKGLFSGMGDGKFAPEVSLTRGMFVTVLGRFAQAEPSKTSEFADVEPGAYYAPYIAWASSSGIVNGVGDNQFMPEASITREQMAVIIFNYMKNAQITLEEKNEGAAFTDDASIADWAKEAVGAMQKAGLINGREDGSFDPKGTATRAESAAIIRRLVDAAEK